MTTTEAFQAGFLMRCAADGLSTDEARARIKAATGGLGYLAGELVEAPARVLSSVGVPLGVATGLAGVGLPVAAGATAGYLGAKLTDDDSDIGAAKDEELIAEYQRQADRARRQAAIKALQARTPVRPPVRGI